MKDLLKRKKDEKERLIRLMECCDDLDKLKKAEKTYLELEAFDLFDPIKEKISSDRASIYDDTIDSDFLNFAIDIINIMSGMPLLETEAVIQYPTLRTTKKVSDREIRDFWNQVFNKETNSTLFTKDNTIFIRPSFIQRLTATNGRFAIYNNYITDSKTLILHRFESPRDFVNPYFMQMSGYIRKSNYSNILEYYMQGRSIQNLSSGDRADLTYIYYDRLVFKARMLKAYINRGGLSASKRLEIVNYADEVIGLILTQESCTLKELANFDSILDVNKDCYTDTLSTLEKQDTKMKKLVSTQKR